MHPSAAAIRQASLLELQEARGVKGDLPCIEIAVWFPAMAPRGPLNQPRRDDERLSLVRSQQVAGAVFFFDHVAKGQGAAGRIPSPSTPARLPRMRRRDGIGPSQSRQKRPVPSHRREHSLSKAV